MKAYLWVLLALGLLVVGEGKHLNLEEKAKEQARSIKDLEHLYFHDISASVHAMKTKHDSRDEAADEVALSLRARGHNSGGTTCASATPITVGATVSGELLKQTARAAGLPKNCGSAKIENENVLFFKVPAGIRGTHYATTCGTSTDFDTTISILEGSCDSGALSCIKGADDDSFCSADSSHSTAQFIAKADKQYYIVVTGYKAGTGKFQLTFGAARIRGKLAENHAAHKTDKYRAEDGTPNKDFLIVRRDMPVDLEITSADAVASFDLVLAPRSAPADGIDTLALPAISPTAMKLGYSFNDMWAMPVDKNGHTLTWRLRLPANAPIGQFGVRVNFIGGVSLFLYEDMIVLFNPTSRNDVVYMEKQSDLNEYVFNESGALYKGSSASNFWIPWAYDQFNLINLLTTNNLLTGSTIPQRRSPVFIARRLSFRLNSKSGGLLAGNWGTGPDAFAGGTEPGSWADSTDIFTKFTYAGGKSRVDKTVRFGQCWVFAGVFTTALRTLGIPGRPVTNFDSAHEAAPYDQNVDIFYRYNASIKALQKDERATRDSFWNFHVWNEAWFKRLDLENSDGWQAVDATPQELSAGPVEVPFSSRVNQMGPASITAMARGDISGGYDAGFVTSEVNARRRDFYWSEETRKWTLLGVRDSYMGTKILTKAPDADCPGANVQSRRYSSVCTIDLRATGHYARKFPDSSKVDAVPQPREPARSAGDAALAVSSMTSADFPWVSNMLKGLRSAVRNLPFFRASSAVTEPAKDIPKEETSKAISFVLTTPDHAKAGDPFTVKFSARAAGTAANGASEFTGTMAFDVRAVTNEGTVLGDVGSISEEVKISAGSTKEISLEVLPEKYVGFLRGTSTLRVTFSALLSGDQNYVNTVIVLIPPPVVNVECPLTSVAGSKLTCKVTFTNPLDIPLTDLKLLAHLSGNGVNRNPEPVQNTLEPKATLTRDVVVDVQVPGTHSFIAIVTCKELTDLDKSVNVNVSGTPVANPAVDHDLKALDSVNKAPTNAQ